MVKLLRWDLPVAGPQYHSHDGSALLSDVARHFHVKEDAIITALSPEMGGKLRVMVYEIGLEDKREKRICALGGHGFLVFS